MPANGARGQASLSDSCLLYPLTVAKAGLPVPGCLATGEAWALDANLQGRPQHVSVAYPACQLVGKLQTYPLSASVQFYRLGVPELMVSIVYRERFAGRRAARTEAGRGLALDAMTYDAHSLRRARPRSSETTVRSGTALKRTL